MAKKFVDRGDVLKSFDIQEGWTVDNWIKAARRIYAASIRNGGRFMTEDGRSTRFNNVDVAQFLKVLIEAERSGVLKELEREKEIADLVERAFTTFPPESELHQWADAALRDFENGKSGFQFELLLSVLAEDKEGGGDGET